MSNWRKLCYTSLMLCVASTWRKFVILYKYFVNCLAENLFGCFIPSSWVEEILQITSHNYGFETVCC